MSSPSPSKISEDSAFMRGWPFSPSQLTPPAAAFAAKFPISYAISVMHRERALARTTFLGALKQAASEALFTGLTAGPQLIAQHVIEKRLTRACGQGNQKYVGWAAMMASCVMVASASAPILEGIKDPSLRHGFLSRLRAISLRECKATAAHQTCFLVAMSSSSRASQKVKEVIGDNDVAGYFTIFFCGNLGGLAAHISDQIILSGRSIRVIGIRQLMIGAPEAAVAAGTFSVAYNVAKRLLDLEVRGDRS